MKVRLAAAADAPGNALGRWSPITLLWGGAAFRRATPATTTSSSRACSQHEACARLQLADASARAARRACPANRRRSSRSRACATTRSSATARRIKIYRGDMHRHTELSLDGAGDGTLWDAYRYAHGCRRHGFHRGHRSPVRQPGVHVVAHREGVGHVPRARLLHRHLRHRAQRQLSERPSQPALRAARRAHSRYRP